MARRRSRSGQACPAWTAARGWHEAARGIGQEGRLSMASGFVDLHSHSTASDGTLEPAEVAQLAQRSGLDGFALTDHDTIAGLAEAGAEARRLGLEFVPGIEISCTYPQPGTMHLLGYCVDPQSPVL